MSTERMPRARARNVGRVTDTLERIAKDYRDAHPGQATRWIYDPKHRPELSGVMGRAAQGWVAVKGKMLRDEKLIEAFSIDPDQPVRVGDVILMSISEAERLEIQLDNEAAANDQLQSIDANYFKAIEEIEVEDERHKPKARGRSVIEEREFEFDYVQKTSSGEE